MFSPSRGLQSQSKNLFYFFLISSGGCRSLSSLRWAGDFTVIYPNFYPWKQFLQAPDSFDWNAGVLTFSSHSLVKKKKLSSLWNQSDLFFFQSSLRGAYLFMFLEHNLPNIVVHWIVTFQIFSLSSWKWTEYMLHSDVSAVGQTRWGWLWRMHSDTLSTSAAIWQM